MFSLKVIQEELNKFNRWIETKDKTKYKQCHGCGIYFETKYNTSTKECKDCKEYIRAISS